MVPKNKASAAPTNKGGGKQKAKSEQAQTSTIDFALPQSMSVALQSISTRATQDLWASSAFQEDCLTAEQMAQRRTNSMSKLSKRLAGNVRAKSDMASALNGWMVQMSQHLLGLVGRVRAIGSKVDEDLSLAIQDMQTYLATQPSQLTADQVMQAERAMGPIWTSFQEQEVLRLASILKAFGTVPAPGLAALEPQMLPFQQPDLQGRPSGDHPQASSGRISTPDREYAASTSGALPSSAPSGITPALHAPAMDQTSVASFGGAGEADPALVAATVRGPRWKRRSAGIGARPSKSPRRETTPLGSPWPTAATGRTPEGLRREAQTQMDDEPELLPDHGDRPAGSMSSWCHYWLQLASFAVEHGADFVGSLTVDEAQNAFLPLAEATGDSASLAQQAEQTWLELQAAVREKDERKVFQVCLALHQMLQGARTVLPG